MALYLPCYLQYNIFMCKNTDLFYSGDLSKYKLSVVQAREKQIDIIGFDHSGFNVFEQKTDEK